MTIKDKPYGCLMIDFKIDHWQQLISLINDSDLYTGDGETDQTFGREFAPHTTILYGLHHDYIDMGKLRKIALPLKSLVVILKDISFFKNPLYDVLKFNIQSSELSDMNRQYKSTFANTSTYPNYNPHITIAYLQPGKGSKYVNKIGHKLKCNIENDVAHFNKPYVINPHKYSYSYNFKTLETFMK